MSNFTKAPNEVVFNSNLSLGARVAHTALLHLSWKAGRRSDNDEVEMPPLDVLARLVGCSRTAFQGYVKELRTERLVFTKRVRNQGMLYMVLERPATGEELGRIPDELSKLARPESGRSRAGAILTHLKTGVEANASTHAPDVVLVDGQNLGFNAIRDACKIDQRGNRGRLVAVALYGKGTTKGIRDLFWIEVNDWATENSRLDVLDDPEWFEAALARAIERKAALYSARMPDKILLTPTALREWWLDLEAQKSRGGMTADEIRNFSE